MTLKTHKYLFINLFWQSQITGLNMSVRSEPRVGGWWLWTHLIRLADVEQVQPVAVPAVDDFGKLQLLGSFWHFSGGADVPVRTPVSTVWPSAGRSWETLSFMPAPLHAPPPDPLSELSRSAELCLNEGGDFLNMDLKNKNLWRAGWTVAAQIRTETCRASSCPSIFTPAQTCGPEESPLPRHAGHFPTRFPVQSSPRMWGSFCPLLPRIRGQLWTEQKPRQKPRFFTV